MPPEIATPETGTDAVDADVARSVVDHPARVRAARFRVDPGSRGVRALAVAAVLLAAAVGAVVMRDAPQVSAVPPLPPLLTESESPTATAPTAEMVISVLGAVVRPGLVTVPAESRVADVVAAAGGRRDDADLFGLNWAAKVSDGDQVVVGSTTGSVPLAPTPVAAAGGAPDGAPAGVSLNEATEAELDALPGVGPVTASAIVQWRNENGGFTSLDQLSEVSGVGPARLEKLKSLVTL